MKFWFCDFIKDKIKIFFQINVSFADFFAA